MHRRIRTLLHALAAASLVPASALATHVPIIDKPVISPPFSEAQQERDLHRDLPLVPWTYALWDRDRLPQGCVAEAKYAGYNPADFQAAEVWYQDCAAS
jgi:hypothetical protein